MEKLDYKISLVIVDSDIDLEPTQEISPDAQRISLVIVDSDINLEPTHEIDPDAPKIDLMFSTIFKGDPGQAELTHELVAELSIGGVSSGRVFPVGTPLENILREMFTSTLARARVGSAIVGRSKIS